MIVTFQFFEEGACARRSKNLRWPSMEEILFLFSNPNVSPSTCLRD